MTKSNGKKSSKPAAAKKKGASAKKPSMKGRILQALASQHSLGKETVEKELIMSLCAVTNKHTFETTCSSMKKDNLVDYSGSTLGMKLTDLGREKVGPDAVAPPVDNAAAQETLRENLKSSKSKQMFDILTDGAAHSRAELAEKVGMDAGAKTFKTYISYLSKIVEKVEDGKVRLINAAFPCGRPCNE
jgi:hypothetical protein